jgi:N-dimethylarginine dimethylaminohydrolase
MTAKIFMCSPDYYLNIAYEINAWMKKGTHCDNKTAVDRWNDLKKILTDQLGAEVLTMQPQPGQPDIVFTANAALIYKDTAVISKFKPPERQAEEKFYAEWLQKQGFNIEYLPENMYFEGAGDALFSGETLYSGYITRSDITAHTYISYLLNLRIISLELADKRFYHLDTCFCPLSDGYLMYYPAAFDDYAQKILEKDFPEEKRIIVTEEEALKFSCNAVNIDKAVIMNNTTDRLKNVLKEKGFDTYEVELSEFMKSGGSAKCLTLKLN